MRRNSNLGRPKLSLHRLLGQTSNLERVTQGKNASNQSSESDQKGILAGQ